MQENTRFTLVIIIIALMLNVCLSCKTVKESTPKGLPCDFSALSVSSMEKYNFSCDFSDYFTQSPRWESENADISIVEGKGQLTANASSTFNALEAWKLFRTQMPYNKSWDISLEVYLPLYWNSNGGNQAQVGAGIFVGKPVDSGQSPKVYECNFAAINGEIRFVQAQLIANRLGGDPIDVQETILAPSKERALLKIQFCALNKTLALYIDNAIVGVCRAIDSAGLDNWQLLETDMMDVGIMGFAEHTVITSNQPTIDNFSYHIY